MKNTINFTLKPETVDDLQRLSLLLKKDINTMLDEALEQYFKTEQEKLIAKEQNATNLSYDEFWDGVDI